MTHIAAQETECVPVSTETTAKIKFVGTAQLEVAYEYESVNGRPANVTAERR